VPDSFIILILAYVAAAWLRPSFRYLRSLLTVLGLAVVVSAFWLNGRTGLHFTSNPLLFAIIGLAGGHILFGVSLLLTNGSVRETVQYTFTLRQAVGFWAKRPMPLVQALIVAFYEEFVWRATVQEDLVARLGSPFVAVPVAAIFFTVLHRHTFTDRHQKVEFLIFSLILGGAYLATGSLVLVVLIHAVRNTDIRFRLSTKRWTEFVEQSIELRRQVGLEPQPGTASSRS
jgi:membrane protease YdiL (CAAX protease family)